MEQIPERFLGYKAAYFLVAFAILLFLQHLHLDLRDGLVCSMYSVVLLQVVIVLVTALPKHGRKNSFEEPAPLVLLFVTGLTTIVTLLEIDLLHVLGWFKNSGLSVAATMSLVVWAFAQLFCSALIMWACYPSEALGKKRIGPWGLLPVLVCEGLFLLIAVLCW